MAVMIIVNQPNQSRHDKRSQVFPWIARFPDGSRLELCNGIKPLKEHRQPNFLLEGRMPNLPDRFKPHVDESLSKGTDTWTNLRWSLVLVKWTSLEISCHQHISQLPQLLAPLWNLRVSLFTHCAVLCSGRDGCETGPFPFHLLSSHLS